MIKNQKGFTLVELVIVITILAILSALGVQSYGVYITKAKAQTDVEAANMIAEAAIKAMADSNFTDHTPGSISAEIDASHPLFQNVQQTTVSGWNSAAGGNVTPLAFTAGAAGATDPTSELINGKYLTGIPSPKSFKTGGTWYIQNEAATGQVRVYLTGSNDAGATTNYIMLYPKAASQWPSNPWANLK